MIIVMADNVNRISQANYDEIVNELDRERIRCNECGQYGFNINCYYYRSIGRPVLELGGMGHLGVRTKSWTAIRHLA